MSNDVDAKLLKRSPHTAYSRTYLIAAYDDDSFNALESGEMKGRIVKMNFEGQHPDLAKAIDGTKKLCTIRGMGEPYWTPPPGASCHPKHMLEVENILCECDKCMRGSSQDCISMEKVDLFTETAERKEVRIQQLWDASAAGVRGEELEDEVGRFNVAPSDLTVDDVHLLQYRGLQSACKVLKLGARGNADVLRERLLNYLAQQSSNEEEDGSDEEDGF